nr:P74 [Calliteara abietis nucleopolyhedrovirus]
MATLTVTDLTNASKYATHQHRLRFIPRWRTKLPHILINYEIRPAVNDDFYVPRGLSDKAIAVRLTFSERGCSSMSCYPFDETHPIDYASSTGYTQTSDTAVQYAQPACYHLNRALATRENAENEVQSPELRYTDTNRCILMDTLSKIYFNSPYFRTEEHLIQGVDDVPGFNVETNDDQLFPEMFRGYFNEAYCRRFGRSLNPSGGCSLQWWETLLGFVLGDTIYITFKLLANNIFSELNTFDYEHPSPILPLKPTIDSDRLLRDWSAVRDATVDAEFEGNFATYESFQDLRIAYNGKLIYTAERGFTNEWFPRKLEFRQASVDSSAVAASQQNDQRQQLDDETIESIITQFLEDYNLLIGISVSIGFDYLLDAFKYMLKKINTALIPALKRMLLTTSKRVTVRLLGETYKAALVHQFNRVAIKTISAAAKAMVKVTAKAASVVGVLLIFITLADLVLAIWDPFGYSNMFPRTFPDDMSNSFLTAYFESMGETRDMIEYLPEFYDEFIEDDDSAMLESVLYILDYVSALEVNSNGQMLNLEDSAAIDDFDEATLVGSALASSSLYTKLDFMQYTQRHNDALHTDDNPYNSAIDKVLVGLFAAAALTILVRNSRTDADHNLGFVFLLFLLLALYLIIKNSLNYYFNLREHTESAKPLWYQNLYT